MALGVLSAGPYGGLVALGSYSAAGAAALALLGLLLKPAEGAHPAAHSLYCHAGCGWAGLVIVAMQMGLIAAAVALVASSARQLHGALASPFERALSVSTAALAVCAPAATWTLPAALLLAGAAGIFHRWYQVRRDGAGAADTAAAEATVPCRPAVDTDAVEAESAADYEQRVEMIRSGREPASVATVPLQLPLGRWWSSLFVGLWLLTPPLLLLLAASPMAGWPEHLIEPSYVSATLVWGEGGLALLPMVLREASPTLASRPALLTAIALVQCLPGPAAFSLGAFVGAAYAGPLGAVLGYLAMHLPSLLALYAALPHWAVLRASLRLRAATNALHAACAGLAVAAALLLFSSAATPPQQAIALLAFASHDARWPASKLRLPLSAHPPFTVAVGAVLGVPFCLPWMATVPGPRAAQTSAPAPAPASGGYDGGEDAHHTAPIYAHPSVAPAADALPPHPPPPPPSPDPPDPLPPPPPSPYPPDDWT